VIPTVIANAFYLPHHLLPKPEPEGVSIEHATVTPLRQVSSRAE
jgi:hypothetical protein